jgi:hypothetical protein
MKTLICATRKPQRSILPIAPFEFESFEVRIRKITRHKPLVTGAAFRRLNIHLPSSQSKTILTPIDAAQAAEMFLPSPSLQGLGEMRFLQTNALAKKGQEPESIASRTHNSNESTEDIHAHHVLVFGHLSARLPRKLGWLV